MTATARTQGPLPGAYPNLTVWVTPVWDAGTPYSQSAFEACLNLVNGDLSTPADTIQIVNGIYGFSVEPAEADDAVTAFNNILLSCLEP